jgi:protein-L-isoaspartate(D-aspartate) O-methyltransferase
MKGDIERARRWFAEDLRVAAGIKTDSIVNAFARVPREKFVGPAPWRMGTRLMRMGGPLLEYQTFEGDPAVLYHDVVVALDEQREINNGQPSLWAKLFEECQPRSGERMLHLGCGTGYYTAILAEIAGPNSSVHGVEVEPGLAERAKEALACWPNVTVAGGDGVVVAADAWDLIVVSAGATHPLSSWLAGLRPNGRLLFPLTADSPNPRSGNGAMLLISRRADGAFAARFLTPAGFVHFEGGREPEASARLLQALRQRFLKASEVHSLRQDQHEEEETCWLHANTFCLSYRNA